MSEDRLLVWCRCTRSAMRFGVGLDTNARRVSIHGRASARRASLPGLVKLARRRSDLSLHLQVVTSAIEP